MSSMLRYTQDPSIQGSHDRLLTKAPALFTAWRARKHMHTTRLIDAVERSVCCWPAQGAMHDDIASSDCRLHVRSCGKSSVVPIPWSISKLDKLRRNSCAAPQRCASSHDCRLLMVHGLPYSQAPHQSRLSCHCRCLCCRRCHHLAGCHRLQAMSVMRVSTEGAHRSCGLAPTSSSSPPWSRQRILLPP